MQFVVQTLIDITETGARRGEDAFEIKQQQNFLTLTQTIGLRINPYYETSPIVSETNIDNLGFGKDYKGKHRMWTFYFDTEYEEGLTVEMLKDDFDIVPVITGLSESIVNGDAFISKNEQSTNILFRNVINKNVL
jgi:hypothetical protein